jgi:hypothetical protein
MTGSVSNFLIVEAKARKGDTRRVWFSRPSYSSPTNTRIILARIWRHASITPDRLISTA